MHPCFLSVLRLTVAAAIGLFTADTALPQTTVWGLAATDRFSVETVTVKETTLTLGDREPETSTTSETSVLQYSVISALPTEMLLQVRVTDSERRSDTPSNRSPAQFLSQNQRLTRLPVALLLDARGVVQSVHQYDEMLQYLAGTSERSARLLKQTVDEKAFVSSIVFPFWLTPPEEKRDVGTSWERQHDLSLGLLGSIRTIMTFEVTEADDNNLKVSVTGNSRHLPPAPGTEPARILSFDQVSVALTSFEGTARLVFPDPLAAEESETQAAEHDGRRPWFDEMQLEWKISGSTVVRSGDSATPLSFQQTLKQRSRLLPGYSVRQRPFQGPPTGAPPR
ncbi:MAG: DUF6263 family protein [Fuerstiella sp.]